MSKQFNLIYRVRNKKTKDFVTNHTTGRTFWTRRADAQRVAGGYGDENEVVMFELKEVKEF